MNGVHKISFFNEPLYRVVLSNKHIKNCDHDYIMSIARNNGVIHMLQSDWWGIDFYFRGEKEAEEFIVLCTVSGYKIEE